jgi:hypothetical protein
MEENDLETPPSLIRDLSDAIEFKSWEEIIARPDYRTDVHPGNAKLDTIIGWYTLRDIRCGLQDCHQVHGMGLVVRTSDGRETNIGHNCGETHFQATFRTLRNRLNQEKTVRFRRQQVRDIQGRREQLQERVQQLRDMPHGADWLNKSLTNFRNAYPKGLVRRLSDRAQRGDNVVTASRERTSAQIDDLMAFNDSLRREDLRYEDVPVGRLEGLEIFQRSIRDIVIFELEQRLQELGEIDVLLLSGNELRAWAAWVGHVDTLIAEAEELINEGQLFFMPNNLRLFERLPLATSEKELLGRVKWNYETGTATVRPPKPFQPWSK